MVAAPGAVVSFVCVVVSVWATLRTKGFSLVALYAQFYIKINSNIKISKFLNT